MKQKLLLGIVVVLGASAIALCVWTYIVTSGIARDMNAVTYSLKGPLDESFSPQELTPETNRERQLVLQYQTLIHTRGTHFNQMGDSYRLRGRLSIVLTIVAALLAALSMVSVLSLGKKIETGTS
jgi:hypothetical protein